MIIYCDTSALIKRYVFEEGTKEVDALWEESFSIATSVVAFAETMSAFSRKLREGVFSTKEFREAASDFKEDFHSLILISVDHRLNQSIESLLMRHPLRGFDAIHLASALVFKELKNSDIRFVCFDRSLNEAALLEGLSVPIRI